MPKRVPIEMKMLYVEKRRVGMTQASAAHECNISIPTASSLDKRFLQTELMLQRLDAPRMGIGDDQLKISSIGKRCLNNFKEFRRRYFGRISTPWQEAAAHSLVELLDSPHKEFVVINVPPGAGKSSLFTHDIPAWLTCRNRGIRGLIGSRTAKQAKTYVSSLRRTLERPRPVKANEELIRSGLAFDARATLVQDYGAFKPENVELWRTDEFIVQQPKAALIHEKEPTWTAFGMDSASLGWRVDFAIWDDVVDNRVMRTPEGVEKQQQWWEDEVETRLEPTGILVLQGQRIAANDLYRHCLNLEGEDDRPKYHHIVYKAHDDEKCASNHSREAPYWPEGCLLDPLRLPWRELATHQKNRASKYRVLYQQEDVDPDAVLVPTIWIAGGRDATGVEYMGCWDNDRDLWELPQNLSGEKFAVATADPSPTKFWSIQGWVYHPDTEQRFLLDLIRQKMDAPDFLEWNMNQGVYSGVMDEWQTKSEDLGVPFRYWVVENNAAQRFLLQYDFVRRWCAKRGVEIIGHATHLNKSDPNFGVQTIATQYKYGRVRLPGKQRTEARIASLKLVDEVTRWPDGGSDDCVMAHWFFEYTLPRIFISGERAPLMKRPSWMVA